MHPIPRSPVKRFLYLFQVEQDLPQNLEGAEGPDSDVRFLSYRARSHDRRSLHYPWSSWTQGRNRLLREFCDGGWLYYVFGDADVHLEVTGHESRKTPRELGPWRAFEEFLLDREPAVGTPAYAWHLSGRWNPEQEVQTLRFFDPVLNAFHREALLTLLPYYDLLDEECTDYSGSLVCSIAADLYPGQVLQSNRVRVLNPFSLRGYTERLMTKPETLYLESLRDPRDTERYLRQPEWSHLPHPGMGTPRRKTASYRITEPELATRYRLDHPLWARKRALLDMPREHEFYGGDPDSARARRWRERNPGSAETPTGILTGLRLSTHALRSRLGLVRTSRMFAAVRRIQRMRHDLVLLWRRGRRLLAGPNARGLWRAWARGGGRPLEIPAGGPDALDLIGHALKGLDASEVIFVEVGTGRGEMLGRLQDGVTQRKPVVSIGVDPVQTRGFTWYTGFVLGTVSGGFMTLSTILRQYGLAGRVLHWLRIAEGDAVAIFRTLGDQAGTCLFLTVPYPASHSDAAGPGTTAWPDTRAALEAAGFRVLCIASIHAERRPEATLVNEALARSLLPRLVP